jgi:hypothetical protein
MSEVTAKFSDEEMEAMNEAIDEFVSDWDTYRTNVTEELIKMTAEDIAHMLSKKIGRMVDTSVVVKGIKETLRQVEAMNREEE